MRHFSPRTILFLVVVLLISSCGNGNDADSGDDDAAVVDDTQSDDDADDSGDDTFDDDIDDTGDDSGDDDTFAPDDCTQPLPDPLLPGSYGIIAKEYGQSGDPDARTTNIQQYFFFPDFYVRWVRGITMNAVPLHGIGHYPDGAGPFPLVLIVHGNHDPAELSYPGYDYITSHLATHGMIAFSIEEDFLNGGVSGEMDARGIVLLRHLQLFREWNETPGHYLDHKVDMNRIGLAGHSRGGEGVTVAWLYNTTKHNPADPLHNFNFKIRSLFAIAPVDGQIGMPFHPITPQNVDYSIMHGSHDGDVSDFQGAACYDRAMPVDEAGTGYKSLLYVQGANHGQWNTVWAPAGDPYPVDYSSIPLMTAQEQQDIGLDFITAWFRWTLQGRACYRYMAAGEVEFPSFPAGHPLNRQYQDANRVFINHYQEDADKTTGSLPGGVNAGTGLAVWNETNLSPGQSKAASVAWNAGGALYRADFPPVDDDTLDTLALRVGQVYEASDVYNDFGVSQDFDVRLVVNGTPTDALPVSDYRDLVYPGKVVLYGYDNSKTILDTVRIPLEDFGGGSPLPSADVEAVILEFTETPSGLLWFDEIQLTQQ